MKKHYLPLLSVLAMAACTGGNTPQGNAPSADSVQVVVPEGETITEELLLSADEIDLIDAEVRSFFNGKNVDNNYVHQHCTPEFQKYLSDMYDYEHDENEEVFATWVFEAQEPGEDNFKEVNFLTIAADGGVMVRLLIRQERNSDVYALRYVYYRVAAVRDGQVIFSECKTLAPEEIPGKLGESAKIWKNNLNKLVDITQSCAPLEIDGFTKYMFVDVDVDENFELLAVAKVQDGDPVACLFTLADSYGEVNGIQNAKLAQSDASIHNRIKVDLDRYMSFTSGLIGMGSTAEECVRIEGSHVEGIYNYVKEVNPDNPSEFAEEASLSNFENGHDISIEEYKKHCTHSSFILSPNYDEDYKSLGWIKVE